MQDPMPMRPSLLALTDDADRAELHGIWPFDRFPDDMYVQGPMQQLVGDRLRGAKGDMTQERATLDTAYGLLERHMANRTWVAGRGFSMADCAAAPALFYASTIQPFLDDHRHLKAYFDRLTERPSFHRVLEEAKPYFSFYPFVDAIPNKFR